MGQIKTEKYTYPLGRSISKTTSRTWCHYSAAWNS